MKVEKVPAILLLQDGSVFHGFSAGKIGTTSGEICFNTSMTGYQEVFTDPSYHRQILVATNVHIGNYGIEPTESESSSVKIAGLVVRNFSIPFSRQKAGSNIQDYLVANNLIAITGVDTRKLVNHLRSVGSMNAIISSEELDLDVLKSKLNDVPSMEGLALADEVSGKEAEEFGFSNDGPRVALLDFGFKLNIAKELEQRGCRIKVFKHNASVDEIKAWNPNGIMLSNGPGDPDTMDSEASLIRSLVDSKIPTFGICLGHQLLGKAYGLKTFKMKFGHRGINQPVKNLITGLSEITSQNHGFAIDPASLENSSEVELTHVNLNDDSVEGIRLKSLPAFSVQYHPESNPGPHDSKYLFDQFIQTMQNA